MARHDLGGVSSVETRRGSEPGRAVECERTSTVAAATSWLVLLTRLLADQLLQHEDHGHLVIVRLDRRVGASIHKLGHALGVAEIQGR